MPVRRTSVAIAAIAAAGLVPAPGSAAHAAGHGHGHGHGGQGGPAAVHGGPAQTRQLTHQIAGLDRRLTRLESSHLVTSLGDTDEQALDANIEADRASLAELAGGISLMSADDVRAARRELHGFRVQNYVLAVTILHRAESLADAASTVPAAQDELDLAVTAALSLTASSGKGDVRDARSHVEAAQTAIDDDADGTDDSTDGTDESTDGTGDSTDGTDDTTDGTDDSTDDSGSGDDLTA